MDSQKILELNDLKVHFKTDEGLLKAVDGVSFSIEKGKTLGLVGESGCGKSVTSQAVLKLLPKTAVIEGKILLKTDNEVDIAKVDNESSEIKSIRGKDISMIFQEPMTSFSPLYTMGNQVMEALLLHRTKDKKEARNIAIEMLRKVGISNPEVRIDQYPHEFSGGMRQRVMIAMALCCNPHLLIADEPTTALDVTIQAQVLELMKKLQKSMDMSILFITHDLGVVAEMCDDVCVMYLGKIVEKGTVDDIFYNPKHPYTRGLLQSIPNINATDKDDLYSIEGNVPVPINLPPKCGFADRCDKMIQGLCDCNDVPFAEIDNGQFVRCFLYDEVKALHEKNLQGEACAE